MKNEQLDEFLYKNRLKSSDLVEYWGVTKGVVSQILNGTTKLPAKRLAELLNNDRGWDVSMLMDSDQPENPAEAPGTERAALSSAEMLLREMLTEKEGKIDALNQVIWELKEENGKLKALLGERKGGTAADADFSSAADAV